MSEVTLSKEETEALYEAVQDAKRDAWDPEKIKVLLTLERKLRRADTLKLHPDD